MTWPRPSAVVARTTAAEVAGRLAPPGGRASPRSAVADVIAGDGTPSRRQSPCRCSVCAEDVDGGAVATVAGLVIEPSRMPCVGASQRTCCPRAGLMPPLGGHQAVNASVAPR